MKKFLFEDEAIRNLKDNDQVLFKKFGAGSIEALPFDCIHHAIEAQARIQPQAIAAIHLGDQITYEELNRQADRLAALLLAHGVKKGDNVGLFVKRSIPMLVGILATLKIGAAYVPQDIGVSSKSRLNYIIDVTSIQVSLTLSSYKAKVPVTNKGVVIAIDEVMNGQITFDHKLLNPINPSPPITKKDRCFVLFTSGTTGKPNGVQVTHENLCNILLLSPGNLTIQSGWKVSQILNIAFDMAAWEILGALSHGACLIIRGDDIQAAAMQADVIIATPSILGLVDPAKCSSIKKVAVAGEPCPVFLANKWADYCDFYNCCGPTETTIVNTMQLCSPNANHITIGKPTPNNTVYILDDDLKPCPIGEVGIMWAGGLCITKGYINNDKLNKERYALDPFLNDGSLMFRTGDLGCWTKEGQLEHHGRVDDQVKVRGFRVELDGVSAVIESIPSCTRAVTLKLDNRNLASFATPLNVVVDQAFDQIKNELPYYYAPSFIIPLEALPMTERGKIDKRQLLQIALQYQQSKALQMNNIVNPENIIQNGQKQRA